MKGLLIDHLSVTTESGKPILNDVSIKFDDNYRYALVGQNGCGKSTLLNAIMGSPVYVVTGGHILLDGTDLADATTDERAKLGLFLASQYPAEIEGVSYADFLRTSLDSLGVKYQFNDILTNLQTNAKKLGFRNFDYNRDLNVGFSGGEKKKSEILQMLALKPRFAFLDEPDSGLDKISVRRLAELLNEINYPTTLVIVSHHDYLLNSFNNLTTYNLEEL